MSLSALVAIVVLGEHSIFSMHFLAFGPHKIVKGGHLLHFDAEVVPEIDLEHSQSVLREIPR